MRVTTSGKYFNFNFNLYNSTFTLPQIFFFGAIILGTTHELVDTGFTLKSNIPRKFKNIKKGTISSQRKAYFADNKVYISDKLVYSHKDLRYQIEDIDVKDSHIFYVIYKNLNKELTSSYIQTQSLDSLYNKIPSCHKKFNDISGYTLFAQLEDALVSPLLTEEDVAKWNTIYKQIS